eukprot:jgi/Mesvir1/10573/Mv21790-RA.1
MGGSAAENAPQQKKPKLDDSEGTAMETDESPSRTVPGKRVSAASGHEGYSTEMMKLYYARLFPFAEMCAWLSYGNDGKHPQSDAGYLPRREFAFTLEEDIFVRYVTVKDKGDFKARVRRDCPQKIDVGPVYNVDPAKRNAYSASGERAFLPVERELVFDVDMTDYDDVRNCCSGADVCSRCWPLMTVAIEIVDAALREDFGFRNILWVFSGRRGVHCWVCDSKARLLTNEQRSAVAEYFSIYMGADAKNRKVQLSWPLHPSLRRAYTVLYEFWMSDYLPNQGLLETPEAFEKILAMVPDEETCARLRASWQGGGGRRGSHPDARELNVSRWRELERAVDKIPAPKKAKNPALGRCLQEVVFASLYPRLDVEVSKHMNHLLKAPFCIHPKTGRVCVPMDPRNCRTFDPEKVPTLAQLLNELDAQGPSSGAGTTEDADGRDDDIQMTSLASSLKIFHETFLDGLKSSVRAEFAAKAAEQARKPTMVW